MLFLNKFTSIYWLKFYWCLLFRVILPLSHRGFRLCSAPIRLLPWTQLGEVWIRADIVALKTMCLTTWPNVDVLYISPTDTSSMQNLILDSLQQKLQKSCSRRNKNTRHIESSYILQPPKYLLLFVNRFRYINNNITKDRCPIPMDTTVRAWSPQI